MWDRVAAEAVRAIGFDPDLHGAEDYDMLLRAIVAGQRIALVRTPGYRQFALASSLSRRRGDQSRMVRRVLAKHAGQGAGAYLKNVINVLTF